MENLGKKYRIKYYKNKKILSSHYEYLTNLTSDSKYIGITNEWIVDNYYQIVEEEKIIKEFLSNNQACKYAFNKKFDLYAVLKKIFTRSKFKIDMDTLINDLNKYQDNYNHNLTYHEINAIGVVSFLVLIDELAELCERERYRLAEASAADMLIEQVKEDVKKYHEVDINDYISLNDDIVNRPIYLERLNAGLKELGQVSNDVFKQLNQILDKAHINLNDLLESVYQKIAKENLLVANIFTSITKINVIKLETLYRKISKTEYVLRMDPYYGQMTIETKELYRNLVLKNAKKYKLSEYEYAKEIIGRATKENEHIGKYLFKKERVKLRAYVYVSVVAVLTFIISFILSDFLIKPRIISFLLLAIPVSEIVVQLTTRLWNKIYHPTPIPKLDFSNGIPKSSATMTVIVTIVKSVEKVEKMFDTLESYYLANKSDNLYFTLLGDCSGSQHQLEPWDDDVMEAGLRKTEQLNKKYGKDIFYFAYRKRIYSEGEEQWLGFERKRGALEHFNQLLLGKFSEENQEKYYYGHTFKGFNKKIKYVITLDQDTQLVLGTAFSLVGAMAHPMNKPILNADHSKVIAGYGIMQPKVSVDVESTNKSVFTQVYAGIGGYDVYNKVVPNFYQDVFKEGSFWGKGIYDLAVFDEVLTGLFPQNLILSHDLLEGNYIRCAFLSDVEVIDDFPSTYLADATRRHRWARGDMQIASYINPKKGPLTLIERWKIFDNIRMGLQDSSLLIIIFFAFLFGVINPGWWIGFTIFTLLLPILFYIIEKLKIQKERTTKVKHYKNIAYGFKSILIRTFSTFSAIPYNAKLYLDAFIRAIYRMNVSHKGLLAWITADEAAKTTKNTFASYLNNFKINYVVSILLVALVYFFKREYLAFALSISLIFFISSLVYYLISKDIPKDNLELTKKETESLKTLAYDTWKFYDDLLTEKNNYLVPDNYQTNREIKEDNKTSPTNIGFSMMACISAYELGFITVDVALDKIEHIIETVEQLKKWNGHLYNWYNIKTLKRMDPPVVSTIDSGNLIASLFVVKSFVKKQGSTNLKNRIENLIKQANFKHLFNNDKKVFSCGYNAYDETLIPYNYNKFASESRLTSFIAIAKGDIKKEHWFFLDKTLTMYQGRKGLLSWSGTAFEYFMPIIWMRDYPNTLMDESYHFAHFCQKEYMKKVDPSMPWGISESAYNLLDDSQNYKYRAFGVPYLKFKDNSEERIVLSPYSSALAITKFPKDVCHNLLKFKNLGMYGEYGYYESYDYEDKTPIFSYFAHHQGMLLCSLTNYLAKDALRKYFYDDIRVQSFDVLNKEKVQIEPMIDQKIVKYKKYDYNKEIFENDIREYGYISNTPEVSVLSNSRYCVMLNDRGTGFSRYKTIQLNRYCKITEQDYGNFLYIRDLDSNKVWSNTYAPTNVEPDRYHVVFALDNIKYMRVDNDIVTNTEVVVTKRHNAEIRKITFKNVSPKTRRLELTTYTEPIICEKEADISHRVFNNMFIKSEYNKETNSLILKRKLRDSNDKYYFINKLLIENPKDEYTYETERSNFVGRGTDYTQPSGLHKKLTNYVGENLDPISSIRNKVEIASGEEVSVYMICGFGKSKEQVLSIVESYHDEETIDEAFEIATIMVNAATKKLNVSSSDVHLYNMMLNYLNQTSRINLSDERKKLLTNNDLGQDTLWSFGISGERPIMLVEINDISSLNLVQELLKTFEYYKSKCVFVDLVIINSEDEKYAKIIQKAVNDEIYHMYAINNFSTTPGRIVLIERNKINEKQLNLFRAIARLSFNTVYNNSLREQIDRLQRENKINEYNKLPKIVSENTNEEEELLFNNEYGGFNSDGSEYHIINPNTPAPWSNVLTNGKFGTIITNNDTGFTYADNSREFKLTSWTNDTILNDKSEGITINSMPIIWHDCIHGLGYSKFKFKNKEYRVDVTYFVPIDENSKIAIYTIKNLSNKELKLDIDYWINPVLGVSEEKTVRHLVCNYYELNNFLTIQNKYAMHFKDKIAYLTSTEKIASVDIDKVVTKSISFNKDIKKKESITFACVLGCEDNLNSINEMCESYSNFDYIENKLQETINYWKNKIGTIQVKTPDKGFDILLNNWLLYQSYASRIMAKSGFYQVSGAFGFRDQLQDTMNICVVDPDIAKKQIINCAYHQFKEGDVLHWWHADNNFGLRSRYKDDYLWLVYATLEYIRITGDKSILDEMIPFVDAPLLAPDEEERGMTFKYTEDKATLFEHLNIIIEKLFNEIGENGLPLMGGGDWNDGMNKVGIEGKGTSVWLGFFAYEVVNRFIEIVKLYNDSDITKYQDFNSKLKESLLKNAWDGKYYLRAFFDNGNKLGSHENDECKIDLISQSWSILTEIATEDQIKTIIDSVEENLVDEEHGFIKLLTPAFSTSKDNPGYIKDYSKGIRENGGQYTHSVSWYIMALVKLGLNDKAYKYFNMVNPINHTLTKELVNKYCVEPYVIAADIYSNEEFIGHGGWTWYTGSSAWFYRVGIVSILGFNKVGNKLYILPAMPRKWEGYKITYRYGKSIYVINVNNDKDNNEIRVDGKVVKEIELIDDGKSHNVNVNIGKEV